jgi:hypothetical protein
MSEVNFDVLRAPYPASKAELLDLLHPVRTTAQLADAADPINTQDKHVGRCVFNSTTGVPVWADGAGPTDTWSGADGTADHTPS